MRRNAIACWRAKGGVLTWCAVVCLLVCGCHVIIPQPRDEYVDGRLRITYWEKWTGFEGQAIRNVVDRFNQSQNRLYVDLITTSQIDRKILIAVAGGEPPDLVGMWNQAIAPFAEKGVLMPLTPFMEKAGMSKGDFIDVFIDMNTYKGELYGLSTTPATCALFWNKKLFREAGLDPDRPPTTMSELDEMAQKLTKYDASGNLVQLGHSPTEPGWWSFAWGLWFGGDLWDGKEITFDSPENLAAFKWVESYSDRYGTDQLRRFQSGFPTQFATPQNPFFTGKVAMILQGVWMANFIAQYAPDLEWDAAAFPSAVPGLDNVTVAQSDTISIPVGARHPDEAFEFIQYLCSQKELENLNMDQWKFSPLKKVSPEFIANHPNPRIKLFIDLASSPHAFCWPDMLIYYEYMDEITPAFDKVRYGLDTPENLVRQVQERVSKMWDRTRRVLDKRAAIEQGGAP